MIDIIASMKQIGPQPRWQEMRNMQPKYKIGDQVVYPMLGDKGHKRMGIIQAAGNSERYGWSYKVSNEPLGLQQILEADVLSVLTSDGSWKDVTGKSEF